MKTKTTILMAISVAVLSLTAWIPSANAQAPADAEKPQDIVMEEAPIDALMMGLARLANMNVQIDPKILEKKVGPDGKEIPLPKVRIEWKNITPRQALNALLANYGYQAIDDPKTGVTRITIKDPTAQEPMFSRIIQVKFGSASNLAALVKSSLSPRSQVVADPRTGQLLVVATETDFLNISNLLAKLDVPLKQVLIEAHFMETAKNPKTIKGIDWKGTLEFQNFSFGNGITTGETKTSIPGDSHTTTTTLPGGRTLTQTVTDPMKTTTELSTLLGAGGISADTARGWFPHTAFLSADGVKAVLSFLNTSTDTDYLASPRAVVQDNQRTELAVIRNIPILKQTQAPLTQAGTVPPTIDADYERKVGETVINRVGVTLEVQPKILGDNSVFLDLRPEISGLEQPIRQILNGQISEGQVFIRRSLRTQATVPSGYTLVLGGLLEDQTTKGYTKVPLLGDMPVLGLAFRKDSKERTKRNLLIFVTPTVVSEGDFAPSTSNFLKQKMPEKPDLDEPAWETGAPAGKYRPLF